MRRGFLSCVAVAMLLWSGPAFGQQILGAGALPCGEWTKDRADPNALFADGQWVLGFLTAFNFFGNGTGHLTANVNGVAAYLDIYCAQHPLDNLATATQAFIPRKP